MEKGEILSGWSGVEKVASKFQRWPPKETKDPALAQEADSEPLAQTLYRTYSAPVGKRQWAFLKGEL